MNALKTILLVTCAVLSPTLGLSQDDMTGRVETLFDACDNQDVPGGFAAAVIKDGKVLFAKAYGYADNESGAPFTTRTVTNYASVAKQFTGYAVAMLARDGKLNLDDDIRRYLPDLPDFGATITIRHLLYHTSGIRDWWGLVKLSGRYLDDVITEDFMMKLVMNQKELNFKPGESFQYSNTGYFLLARIISKVTGKSFPEWMKENVFRPLGMNDTDFSDNYRSLSLIERGPTKRTKAASFRISPTTWRFTGQAACYPRWMT